MDKVNIINLLTNSGLKIIGIDDNFVLFQDPTCIFPAFDSLLHYAWIIILILLGIMLVGWAVVYIFYGVKFDTLFGNIKSLLIVFALVKPIVNVVYGDSLFSKQCETKTVSLTDVQDLLKQREKKFGKNDLLNQHEVFEVIDSGASYDNDDVLSAVQQNNTTNSQTVEYTKTETIYVNADGTKIVRSGGSVAWRNNNPGNIRKSDFASTNGAIGETDKWAVFPDERTGLNAVVKLLRTQNYNTLSISDAIHRWAPASDNNYPEKYVNHISKTTGLSSTMIINDLSDYDLERVARAMQQFEGWIPGNEYRL